MLAIGALTPLDAAGAAEPAADSAQRLVHGLLEEAHSIDTGAENPQARFRELVSNNLGIRALAEYAVGPYWTAMTPSEREIYMAVLSQRVVEEVSKALLRHGLADFAILDSREIDGGGVVVTSNLTDRGAETRLVLWHLQQAENGLRLFDVLVDGVSLARSRRSEFTSVLRQNGGDVTAFLEQLRSQPAQNGPSSSREPD